MNAPVNGLGMLVQTRKMTRLKVPSRRSKRPRMRSMQYAALSSEKWSTGQKFMKNSSHFTAWYTRPRVRLFIAMYLFLPISTPETVASEARSRCAPIQSYFTRKRMIFSYVHRTPRSCTAYRSDQNFVVPSAASIHPRRIPSRANLFDTKKSRGHPNFTTFFPAWFGKK